MLTNTRHEKILKLLEQRGSVSLQELKELLHTSESTIRRDLTQLHGAGRLVKVFGGAVACEKLDQTDVQVPDREIRNRDEKQMIAAYGAKLIRNQDFVYIDAGTTTACMIPFLTDQTATYVTNAPSHAIKMAQAGLNVVLLGGNMKPSTEAAVGSLTCAQLERYHFSVAFLGTNGVSQHAQLSTPDPEEAMVKSVVVRRSRNCYVLCDHTKFHKISPVTFAAIEDVIVLTDAVPEGAFRDIPNIVDITGEPAEETGEM